MIPLLKIFEPPDGPPILTSCRRRRHKRSIEKAEKGSLNQKYETVFRLVVDRYKNDEIHKPSEVGNPPFCEFTLASSDMLVRGGKA